MVIRNYSEGLDEGFGSTKARKQSRRNFLKGLAPLTQLVKVRRGRLGKRYYIKNLPQIRLISHN